MKLSSSELAAILAGLRLLQRAGDDLPKSIYDIYADAGTPLSILEIDYLCEYLNEEAGDDYDDGQPSDLQEHSDFAHDDYLDNLDHSESL